MGHAVFIDKIGSIFDGSYNEAIENYENYKDYSNKGIGRFANKNVYLLDNDGIIVKSFGSTKFKDGGVITESVDFIKDFILGKKIADKDLSDDFTMLESSALIYRSSDGTHPLITKKSKHSAVFHKSNFSKNDFINSMLEKFKETCIKNAIQFEII